MDRSGTIHTFRYRRGVLLYIGIFTAGCAIALGVVLIASDANSGRHIWPATLLAVVVSFLGVWCGIRMTSAGVKISDGKMTIRNFFRTHEINASEIRAITLEYRAASGGYWQPQVHLTGGRSIRLQGFSTSVVGSRDSPPEPRLVTILDEIRALLAVRADDAGQPETRS